VFVFDDRIRTKVSKNIIAILQLKRIMCTCIVAQVFTVDIFIYTFEFSSCKSS